MASQVIGALRVSLALDTAQFSQGIENAQSAAARLAANLKGPLLAAGAAVSAAMVGFAYAIKGAIDSADDLGKTAQKIGIPVEELSKLKYAAELSDISLESLSTAAGKLAKNMAAVASGASNDAAKAFAALGISATTSDGSLKSTSEVMSEVAEKFAGMKDGAQKTALAMSIFGKSGADLIPMLNAGKKGLAEAGKEAEAFGIVIDTKTAAASERFNGSITKLQAAAGGLFQQIAAQLAPTLADLAEKFVETVKQGDLAKKLSEGLKSAMEELNKIIITVSAGWAEFNRRMQLAGEVMDAFKSLDFTAIKDAHARAAADIAKIWSDANQKLMGENMSQFDLMTRGGAAAQTSGGSGGSKPITQATTETKNLTSAMEELKATGQSVWEATRTPAEQFAIKMRDLNELMRVGVIDNDTYARAVVQLQDQFKQTGDAVAQVGLSLGEISDTVGDSLRGMFDDALSGSFDLIKSLENLAKQLAELALDDLFAGLKQSGGAGGVLGGIGKLLGFASGGSFRVGGAGGIDSQLVAFKASPNETVSIHKPGQDGGGGGSVVVNVQNPPGTQTEQRNRQSGGQTIVDVVNTLVDKRLAGESTNKLMGAKFGLVPRVTRR